jgi:hypothetical protein
MRGAKLVSHTNIVESQARKEPRGMKLGGVDQAWPAFRDNLPWPSGRVSFDRSGFATFQT